MSTLDIHAYLRAQAGERAHRVGPFLTRFDEQYSDPFRNYAVPDDGAGECCPPRAGLCEIVAVGVRASHRGRRIAGAITALLTEKCPATPFLMTLHDAETSAYRRIGYRNVTEMLHISRR